MTTLENKTQATISSYAKVIYILLMISTIIGFTGLIAIIMAYVMKDDSPEWLQSHYRFQIRTFWIGLLYITIGAFTFQIVIGYFILLFTIVWMLIRCSKGLKQLANEQAVKNVESWFFT
jgi:uncharacterized membrane protein